MLLKSVMRCMVIAVLIAAQSCGDNNDDPAPEHEAILPDPEKTDAGIPNGVLVSQSIGASGGVITSADGALTISIPAGALSATRLITIQPITNNVSLGVGAGYRLAPEGTTFAQPVTLTFKYNDGMLDNKPAETLWITTQNSDGSWSANIRSVVDEDNKTVTAMTTHFSDWALGRFIDFQIAPATSTVMVGKSIGLGIVGFLKDVEDEDSPDDLVPLKPIVDDGLEPLTPLTPIPPVESRYVQFRVKNWSLNGVNAPVSNNNGSLTPVGNFCTYKAPAKKPSPSTVAVTAELETTNKEGSKSKMLVVANVNIIDGEYYLRVNIDGTEYVYLQYGINGSVPEGDNFAMVNSAFVDGEVFGIGAGYYNGGSNLTNAFTAVFENPGVGTTSVSCFNADDPSKDEVAFIYDVTGRALSNSYTKRWLENDVCESELLCASFSRTFTQYEDKAMGTVAGSFAGTLYEVPANNGGGDNCTTPKQHSVSGDFRLVRVQ